MTHRQSLNESSYKPLNKSYYSRLMECFEKTMISTTDPSDVQEFKVYRIEGNWNGNATGGARIGKPKSLLSGSRMRNEATPLIR
jgi:hypothetical protein